jgi:hypothetical protein
MSPLHPLVTPCAIVLAFEGCLAVGIIFGSLPAPRCAP